MPSTNKTLSLQLSQYIATDMPTYLNDYNSDMQKIDDAVTALQSKDTSHDSAIVALQNKNSSHDSAIAALQSKDSSHDSTITALKSKGASHDSAIATLESNDSSHDSAITALQSKDSSHDSAIIALQNSVASKLTAPNGTMNEVIAGDGTLISQVMIQKGYIEEGVDFNSITQTGMYIWARANQTLDQPNAPTQSGGYGILEVYHDSYYTLQRLTRHGDGACWVRIAGGSSWKGWRQMTPGL